VNESSIIQLEVKMRHVVTVEGSMGKKRAMLVENSQDPRYQDGIVCFLYLDNLDGPAEGGEFYDGFTIDQVKAEFERDFDVPQTAWTAIPDQLAGCQDDWVAPVRIARDERGEQMAGEWEQLVDQKWVRIMAAKNSD
jgi:hypothetical protein